MIAIEVVEEEWDEVGEGGGVDDGVRVIVVGAIGVGRASTQPNCGAGGGVVGLVVVVVIVVELDTDCDPGGDVGGRCVSSCCCLGWVLGVQEEEEDEEEPFWGLFP